MLDGHGGNIYETARLLGCAPSKIIDMSSNINPLGPPTGLLDFLRKNIDAVTFLPEVDSREITTHFARHFDFKNISYSRSQSWIRGLIRRNHKKIQTLSAAMECEQPGPGRGALSGRTRDRSQFVYQKNHMFAEKIQSVLQISKTRSQSPGKRQSFGG